MGILEDKIREFLSISSFNDASIGSGYCYNHGYGYGSGYGCGKGGDCADGYGEVCTATPHCEKCVVRSKCKNNTSGVFNDDILRKVCADCDMNPTKIGQYILEKLICR